VNEGLADVEAVRKEIRVRVAAIVSPTLRVM
jgi:hypothetical protein